MSGQGRIQLAALAPTEAAELARRIQLARLVCFPTDTVYGVGGALTAGVGEAIVAAKGRDPAKPLQVIFPTLVMLEARVPLAPATMTACRALLPGPLTLVVPYPPGWTLPPPAATLGVRVPVWPTAARVLAELAFPLVASSANPSGGPAPAALDEVDAELLARCDLILDAGRVGGLASTVVDLSDYAISGRWRVLRAGALSEADVAARLAAAAPARGAS